MFEMQVKLFVKIIPFEWGFGQTESANCSLRQKKNKKLIHKKIPHIEQSLKWEDQTFFMVRYRPCQKVIFEKIAEV